MPPIDTSPQSRERYFLRILAALAREHGGELRIKQSLIDEVNGAGARQALFEDFDSRKQEIVLRFGSKLSAIYPFEADVCPVPKQEPSIQPQTSTPPSFETSPPRSRKPLTDEQLREIERKGKQLANAARIKREQQTSFAL